MESKIAGHISIDSPVSTHSLMKDITGIRDGLHKHLVSEKCSPMQYHTLNISRCHNSQIFYLEAVQFVFVTRCTDTIIVLASVGRMIVLEHCENVTLISPCRMVRVSMCIDCTLYICCNVSPIITNDSRNISLAPYNSYYPGINDTMWHSGLHPHASKFEDPIILGVEHIEDHSSSIAVPGGRSMTRTNEDIFKLRISKDCTQWRLMPPEQFSPFVIPFFPLEDSESEGDRPISPCIIPPEYSDSFMEKLQSIASLFQLMQTAFKSNGPTQQHHSIMSSNDVRPRTHDQVQHFIQNRFKNWLITSGKMKEITQLLQDSQSAK